jgi:biopolymer transport protein ExbD
MDITALVDCVFLLLVFFLLTSTFIRQRDMGLELAPVVTGEPVDTQSRPLEIVVDREGLILVEERVINEDALAACLENEGAVSEGRPVRILTDRDAPAGRVVFVLDTARATGVATVDLVGKATEAEEGGE